MKWLATRAFIMHTLITLIGLIWAILIHQPLLSITFVALWVLALVTWLEWKNAF